MHMSRASLFFILDGSVHRCPSREQLLAMVSGDRVGVIACPCKNDPLGIHFVPFPLIFNFNPLDVADTGLALRDLALYCWVPPNALRSTPMLSSAPSGEPIRRDFLDLVLIATLLCFLTAAEASLYSWHSFRIGLACSLRAAMAPDWIILALCRWRSAASIPVYGRVNYDTTSSWIDAASAQHVESVQTTNLPGLGGKPVPRNSVSLVPSILPEEVYNFVNFGQSASESLTTAQLQSLSAEIPEIDDDMFMFELSQCPESNRHDGEDT